MGRQGTLQVEVGGRNGGSPTSKAARSPTIEEQKSINMAESLNMRAMEADGKAFEESNWYELRPTGSQPQRRGYHAAFVYQMLPCSVHMPCCIGFRRVEVVPPLD